MESQKPIVKTLLDRLLLIYIAIAWIVASLTIWSVIKPFLFGFTLLLFMMFAYFPIMIIVKRWEIRRFKKQREIGEIQNNGTKNNPTD